MSQPQTFGQYTVVGAKTDVRTAFREMEAVDASNRRVVLRILHASADAEQVERFERLARATLGFHHPGIVSCVELGEQDGWLYAVTPEPVGRDLFDTVMDAEFDPIRAAAIVLKAAHALDHAHAVGVLHGHLNPREILLEGHDRIRLTGLGEWQNRDQEYLIGNPCWLAPELFLDEGRASPACDIYALSEIAFFALSRTIPFRSEGIAHHAMQKTRGPVPRLGEVRPSASRAVDEVIARGMAIEPTERFPSARAFANTLAAALMR